MSDGEARPCEEAEAKAKRIERWRKTGHIFDSTPDLHWLFVELALANGGELDWYDKDRLTDFIVEPIWGELWSKKSYSENLIKQAAILVDNSKFHCTALRDFFVLRLTESLAVHVADPVKDRLVAATRKLIAAFLLLLAVVLYLFVNWWSAAAVLFLLMAKAWSWFRELDNAQKCTFRNRHTRDKIREIAATVKRGGFDEPTIIRQLELFDVKIPPIPELVYVYNCPYLLGSDPTGIQEHTIPIPDVLYALLRLPRRNVESKVSWTYNTLSGDKKKAISEQWRAFLDPMLNNDDGEAARKTRDRVEEHRAQIFQPVRRALDQLADDFEPDRDVVFTSRLGRDMFPSTYSIEIREGGKQGYYIYTWCEKDTFETELYSFPVKVTRNPNAYSESLVFYRGDEDKIASTIRKLLLHYREHRELKAGDITRIPHQVQNQSVGT